MEKRITQHAKTEQITRDHRAQKWRKGRKRLDGYGDNIRPILLSYWNIHRRLPGDPMYLLDMLHSYDIGRLNTFATFKAALGGPEEPMTWADRVTETTGRGGDGEGCSIHLDLRSFSIVAKIPFTASIAFCEVSQALTLIRSRFTPSSMRNFSLACAAAGVSE